MFDPKEFTINEQSYRLTYTALNVLLKISPLKINIHNLENKATSGTIFLFNHYTRFETFIPQYILHGDAQVYCRAVADHSLFAGSLLGDYLKSVGAIPDNLENMMNYLVDEINCGRKLIIFPEGAMIKDRKVRDEEGRLSIYKRERGARRKPHTGAAVIAIKCKMLRDLYLMARDKRNDLMVKYYSNSMPCTGNIDQLDRYAHEDVRIIPANITFYPMRRDENILESYVKKFSGVTSKRVLEELKVESNILLKETDMDVRFGKPIKVADYLDVGYQAILKSRYALDAVQAKQGEGLKKTASEIVGKGLDKMTEKWIKSHSNIMRDDFMNAIYDMTTINLAHLTAHTLYDLNSKRAQGTYDIHYLRSLLFLAICDLRNEPELYLHKDIARREPTNDILIGDESHLMKILQRFEKAGLLEIKDGKSFTLKAKLEEEFPFDSIRIENPAEVLDNEAQSVPKAIKSLDRLYKEDSDAVEEKIALLLHRRACKIFEREEEKFSGPEYADVNKIEERTSSGEPFFFRTSKPKKERIGVLLIHGFSASPAEMKVLGDYLFEKGYEVFAVRLPGHGTSPADLKERDREEWIKEVKLGITLMKHHCNKLFIVGNSMGAIAGLIAMETSAAEISGYVAIAPAFRITDRRIALVSYVDAAQKLYQLFADLKTEWPYQSSRPENPHINYCSLPYHGLYELYQITKEAPGVTEQLTIPTLFIQAEREYTVDPVATYEAFEKVPAKDKTLLKIDETRHVLTLDSSLPVFKAIADFIERIK
ncbi:MAG: alpha/beta fold hydrolase [Proteobacteria bacterium]|nr:alpha/beta fold hydrolase [Pseudomonadota bacterium]